MTATWTGPEGERQYVLGKVVHYSLAGSAVELLARLQQLLEAHPDVDPRDIRGTAMVTVAPGLTETERRLTAD